MDLLFHIDICFFFPDKADREGGRPLNMRVNKVDKNGFFAKQDWAGNSEFIAPCVFYAHAATIADKGNGAATSAGTKKVIDHVHLYCKPDKS